MCQMKKCDSTLPGALPAVHHWVTAERPPPLHPMLTFTALLIWKLLLPLLVLIAVIDWLTASDDRRIRILRRTGLTQRQIADRLTLTRYRVRKALA
jgi:hypothetical protein